MKNCYSDINFNLDAPVKVDTLKSIVETSKSQEQLTNILLKTRNFTKVLLKENKEKLDVIAMGRAKHSLVSLKPSKYSFLSVNIHQPFFNLTNRLDNLNIVIKADLPNFDFGNNFLNYFKEELFHKQKIKISYQKYLWKYDNEMSVDFLKGYKAEENYAGVDVSFANWAKVWDKSIDLTLKNRFIQSNSGSVDFNVDIKFKHRTSTLDLKTLPKGQSECFKLIQGLYTKEGKNKFRIEYKKLQFFSPSLLPSYSNIETDIRFFFALNDDFKFNNLTGIGLKNRYHNFDKANLFVGSKFNYYNIKSLSKYDISLFIHGGVLLSDYLNTDADFGFGIQKYIEGMGNVELMYNYIKQGFQLRLDKYA